MFACRANNNVGAHFLKYAERGGDTVRKGIGREWRLTAMRVKLAIDIVALAVCLMGSATPVSAHHAFGAEFDANRPIQFTGTIVKVEWLNPHVWLHIEVKKPDGTTEIWAFEAGTPNVLFRRGFTKQSLMPGTVVKVDGYQAKDGTRRGNGRDLTFQDGRKLFIGSGNGAK
jgi:hypothetical protein